MLALPVLPAFTRKIMTSYKFTKIRQQFARESIADIEQTVHQQVTSKLNIAAGASIGIVQARAITRRRIITFVVINNVMIPAVYRTAGADAHKPDSKTPTRPPSLYASHCSLESRALPFGDCLPSLDCGYDGCAGSTPQRGGPVFRSQPSLGCRVLGTRRSQWRASIGLLSRSGSFPATKFAGFTVWYYRGIGCSRPGTP